MSNAQMGVHERERAARAVSVPATASPEMRRTPPGLTPSQRRLYRRTVAAATWLTPLDTSSLVLWVKATDAIARADDLKLVTREATIAQNLGKQLGLTPQGRMALGITSATQAEPNDNPWGGLRVVSS
jgi:hypothetical protein